MAKKQHLTSRWKERGNIFFTLFAAVGVVGALGVGSTTLLKGPVQTMVKINQKQVTEEYSELGLRVMMANILNNDANCDGDNKLEAAEWEDPTPPFTAPTGGGVFPSTYGTKVTDPWGRHLGYCVWDHGLLIDDTGCGGGTQKRLRGAPADDTQPFITVISAGTNQVFETACNDYVDTTPADGTPDTPLIVKPTNSDDLIVNYSMIDAQNAMGDNWVFTSNETADGDAATTDQNLDFTQDVTFSGLLDLDKLGGGLTLPDFSGGTTCDGTTQGQMFRDSATTPPAIMVCDGGAWKAMSGSGDSDTGNYAYNFDPENPNCTLNNGGPFVEAGSFDTSGSARDVWIEEHYIYVADNLSGLTVFTFNGSDFNYLDAMDRTSGGTGGVIDIWSDGIYIYTAEGTNGIAAYSFDGTSLTLEGSFNTGDNAWEIMGDGQYLYVADENAGVLAFSFDGTNFSQLAQYNTSDLARGLWIDSQYIYVADSNGGLDAFSFDGTSFTELANVPTYEVNGVWSDGNHIYIGTHLAGVRAFSFDGTNFTELADYDISSDTWRIWGDGTHIYTASSNGGASALTFSNSIYQLIDTFDTPDFAHDIKGDGNYIYIADGLSGIRAYSGFECLSTTPDYSDRPDAPNTGVDFNYRAYTWGDETNGELGNGTTATSPQPDPTLVLENNEFYQVSMYRYHACGLKTDGSAWCWGQDAYGQLGHGGAVTGDQETPYPVSGNHKFTKIDTGAAITCGLKANGTVWCWGNNTNGEIGIGVTGGEYNEPQQVINYADFMDIGIQGPNACGLRRNGELYCWGENTLGQLGIGDDLSSMNAPQKVNTSLKFISFSAGFRFNCGLTESGEAWCWGSNDQGQTGKGASSVQENLPVKVQETPKLISIFAGVQQACGLTESGEAWCWGLNANGQLGNGTTSSPQLTPTQVIDITDFTKLSLGVHFTCGIDSSNALYCWGKDSSGELGNGAGVTASQSAPYLVSTIDNVVDISCHNENCIAATKEPKQAPETAPSAPVIIEQKTSAGNTSGSHGLAINYNSATNVNRVGLAFKVDANDTSGSDQVSANIIGQYGSAGGLRIRVSDGSSAPVKMRINKTGALSINSSNANTSPKLSVNEGGVNWLNRFDTGFLISDASGANQSSFYGVDASTGNAVILSGEDLLIQYTTTDGATVTPIASFVNTGVPEFYGDIFVSGSNRTATISTYTDTADETAAFQFLRYRGTEGGETAIADEDFLGEISFKGFDGTDYHANGALHLHSMSTSTPSVGDVPSRLRIARENGTNTENQLFKISAGGNILIGQEHASSGRLKINGRTTADSTVKAGPDPTCVTADDEGTLRFTGTEYEYCKDDGGGGYEWVSVVADPTCKDDAKIIDINISAENTCFTFSNGNFACIGENDDGEAGINSATSPQIDIKPIPTDKAIKTVTGSLDFSCTLLENGKIKCWGTNINGSLGNGTTTASLVPVSVASNAKYKDITAGDNFTCAIKIDGKIDCWGTNTQGQLGQGDTIGKPIPTEVSGISNVIKIKAAKRSICALKSDQTVSCWGDNDVGQLGIGTETDFETTPQNVSITNVIDIAAGGLTTSLLRNDGVCALRSDDTIWCWGDNEHGQIGNGTSGTANVLTPTQVSGIINIVNISRVGATNCALIDDGTIECWGKGNNGQIGHGAYSNQTIPTTVSNITTAIKLSDGQAGNNFCAILQNGSAQCWGVNNSGQLGNGTTTISNTPVDVINPLSCNSDKYVFVTSQTYDGNLGGLKGADNICQAHADRANLPGRYLAWLSDDTNAPATRFNRVLTDYKLVDDTIIANGWNDLIDGTLDNNIGLDEISNIQNSEVFTNVQTNGQVNELNSRSCNNWINNSATNFSNRGQSNDTSSNWTEWADNFCNASARIYCFQQ